MGVAPASLPKMEVERTTIDARVSCIMPTADRRAFVPLAIENFLRQDYPEPELVIVDDGYDPVRDLVPKHPRIRYEHVAPPLTLGAKRNLGCEAARGDVILHWDDDDWYAPCRVRAQLEILLSRSADLCGLSSLFFWDPPAGKAWRYTYRNDRRPWVAGSTLCYFRQFWERHRFPALASGEDAAFLRQIGHRRIVATRREELAVALIHERNTCRRVIGGERWQPVPVDRICGLMGRDFDSHRRAANRITARAGNRLGRAALYPIQSPPRKRAISPPLVSCVMPTGGRPELAVKAIEYFRRQDYENLELIIVDDAGGLQTLIPHDRRIRHVPVAHGLGSGLKRSLGAEVARGDIVVQWDDDDWYAPQRVTRQVAPIIDGDAEITGLRGGLFFDALGRRFLEISPAAHRKMFAGDVIGGTLAYKKSLLNRSRYPDRPLGEDAVFLLNAMRSGARLIRVPNDGLFVYVRHGGNSWSFEAGSFLGAEHWRVVHRSLIPPADQESYLRFATAVVVS